MENLKHYKLTDTHFYDKNIDSKSLSKIIPILSYSIQKTREDKISTLRSFRNKLRKYKLYKEGIVYYDKILTSYEENNKDNYDSINNLDSIDLLYSIYLISQETEDILEMLLEQLRDMKTGFCPQGRTIRLIQLVISFS